MADNTNNKKKPLSPEEERIMNERMLEKRKQREQQQKIAAEKKEKNNIITKKLILVLEIVLAVVVVISLLFVAARSLGNVTFSKAADYIMQSISNLKPGDGYPVEIGSGKVKDMKTVNSSVALLCDDRVLVLNSTAKELAEYSHSYSKPSMSVSSGRMLITDRTTGRYFIADISDKLREDELNCEVFCSSIGEKGNYAFSCAAEGSSSVLEVYGADFNKVFSFKCASEYIIGISLSPDGKKLAAIALGSKNAELYSMLYIIDIESQQMLSEFNFDSVKLSNVFFSDKNTVITVSDSAYYIAEKDFKEKKEISFGNNIVSGFTPYDNGDFSIVLSKYGSLNSGVIALFDSNGKQKFSAELGSEFEDVSYDGRSICVVDTDNLIHSYSASGTLIGETKLDMSAQRIAVSGKYCYVLCYGDLLRYDVKTNIKEGDK